MRIKHLMLLVVSLSAGYAINAAAFEPSAVLHQPNGLVLVNQATAMIPAQHGMPLYVGNRVMVTAHSKGMVVYNDGCTLSLPENTLLTISGPHQCKKGQATPHLIAGFQNTRIGQTKDPVATIQQLKGPGRVNRAKATRGMNLYKANRVTAGFNGRIVVKYANGCEKVIQRGQSLVIGDVPRCDNLRRPRTDRSRSNEQNSTTQNTQSVQNTPSPTNAEMAVGSSPQAINTGAAVSSLSPWVAPAAVLGGLAGAMALSSNDDNKASPD